MPITCEGIALFQPKVRQEATQNQRQKDWKATRKRELQVVLRAASQGRQKIIPRLPRFFNWKTRFLSSPVTIRIPHFWAYKRPAYLGPLEPILHFSVASARTLRVFTFPVLSIERQLGWHLCALEVSQSLLVAAWGTEAPTSSFETATSPGDKCACIRLICI